MELNHTEAINEMVASGIGVSLVPRSSLVKKKRYANLISLSIENGKLQRSLGLIHLRLKPLRPPTRALLEVLQNHFRSMKLTADKMSACKDARVG